MRDDGFSARAGADPACAARTGADDALLDEVGAMLRSADPVPRHLRDSARNLLTWRTLDAEATELLRGDAPPARPAAH
jgi:hypothetical protein